MLFFVDFIFNKKSRFSIMLKFVALFNAIQMGKKARNMNLLLCASWKIGDQLLQNDFAKFKMQTI